MPQVPKILPAIEPALRPILNCYNGALDGCELAKFSVVDWKRAGFVMSEFKPRVGTVSTGSPRLDPKQLPKNQAVGKGVGLLLAAGTLAELVRGIIEFDYDGSLWLKSPSTQTEEIMGCAYVLNLSATSVQPEPLPQPLPSPQPRRNQTQEKKKRKVAEKRFRVWSVSAHR